MTTPYDTLTDTGSPCCWRCGRPVGNGWSLEEVGGEWVVFCRQCWLDGVTGDDYPDMTTFYMRWGRSGTVTVMRDETGRPVAFNYNEEEEA